ncbi:FkbM family methyltransferase [Massilia sp. TS11]|uniref:FkbM family methyltransferase n=1 Tax=Massilia sp. TS11 TaxID=2908003 RepID=UPI001EDA2637|nr:FkbM family methyltransferase [Massilia sp. TS11]MCG2584985.1 FkbM family methyltransferase [Massilia sp. TS11]
MRSLLIALLRRLCFGAPPVDGPLFARGDAPHLPDVIELEHGQVLVRGRHGWLVGNRYDEYLGKALMLYGEYGEIEQRYLAGLLRPGDTVIEIGANIGSETVGLARAVGPSGRVLAFEPQPGVYQMLCANVALNGLAQVQTFQLGCGAAEATLYVPRYDFGAGGKHNSGAVQLSAEARGEAVSVRPLDQLTTELAQVRLIKIDVEGMERAVLEGAQALLKRCRPILYVENDRAERSMALIEWLQAAGYRLWWHLPPLYNPVNYFGNPANAYPRIVSENMICFPQEAVDEDAVAGLMEVTDASWHPSRTR